MKKILAVLGSVAMVASPTAIVIACSQNDGSRDETDNDRYDETPPIREITTNAVDRMKSIILADQFQLSDQVYWSTILDYDRTNRFSTLFNIDSPFSADKFGFDLSGRGGERNILAKELVQLIINAISNINIPGIDLDLGAIIRNLNIEDYIDQFGEIITILPKTITEMPLQQLMAIIPVLIQGLSGPIGGLIEGIDNRLLNTLAETISRLLQSAVKNYGVESLVTSMQTVSTVENYNNYTFQQLSRRMWMSLLTTVAYAVNGDYVTNPETELDPANSDHLVDKFMAAVAGAAPVAPVEGEVNEFLGVAKYAVSTIKMLELYLQFFGPELFTYVPDVEDWTADDGNVHLFSADQTNAAYIQNLNPQRVDSLTGMQDGVNLPFLWKVIKTFLGDVDHEDTGVMLQKLLNGLLTDYDPNNNNRFMLPIWNDILSHLLDPYNSFILNVRNFVNNNILPQVAGIFTNRTIPETFRGVLGLVGGFLPADAQVYVNELIAFLDSRPQGADFVRKPFDYLWTQDISLIMPSVLAATKTNANVDILSLQVLLTRLSVSGLFGAFGVDLTKYGSSYTDLPLARMINELDKFINIDAMENINSENITLTGLTSLLDLLTKENTIKLEADQDNDPNPLDDSLVRQIISNLRNPDALQTVLGIVINEENQRVEVVKNSFLGLIIQMVYPNLTTADENRYSYEEMSNATSFTANFIKAIGNLLTSLLAGKDYTYLIQPLVLDDRIWRLLDVRNIYFPNSNGQLLYQRLVIDFDPTGKELLDGSVVDATHRGVYELIFQRAAIQEQFFFRQILKQRRR